MLNKEKHQLIMGQILKDICRQAGGLDFADGNRHARHFRCLLFCQKQLGH